MKIPIEDRAKQLMVPLYKERYTQTLWNTPDAGKQEKGWYLKGGIWSPWFLNVRPAGSSPQLFYELNSAMADLLSDHPDVDMLIAVEMAGINLSGGMATASWLEHGLGRPIGYTRPLPRKVRTPMEALALLQAIDDGCVDDRQNKLAEAIRVIEERDLSELPEELKWQSRILNMLKGISFEMVDYGQKDYVEALLTDGLRVGIFDDMATTLGSKFIARLTTLWEAKRREVSVTCDKIFYILNRNPDNRQAGLDFANETEAGLYPSPLEVHYIIEFDERLPDLKTSMKEPEYDTILAFQKNRNHFQDKDVQKEVLALATKTR